MEPVEQPLTLPSVNEAFLELNGDVPPTLRLPARMDNLYEETTDVPELFVLNRLEVFFLAAYFEHVLSGFRCLLFPRIMARISYSLRSFSYLLASISSSSYSQKSGV